MPKDLSWLAQTVRNVQVLACHAPDLSGVDLAFGVGRSQFSGTHAMLTTMGEVQGGGLPSCEHVARPAHFIRQPLASAGRLADEAHGTVSGMPTASVNGGIGGNASFGLGPS